MMIFNVLGTALLIVTILRFHFSFITLIVVSLLIYHLNIYLNESLFSDLAIKIIILCSVVFCIPFLVGKRPAPQLADIQVAAPDAARRGFIAVLVLVVVFSIIHYSRVGLPLFNDNLDEARFQAIESGMLGIPSRITIYGPSIAAFLLLILLNARCIDLRTFAVGSLAIVILLFLQGSKSSVAQYILIAAICYNYLEKSVKSRINWVVVAALMVSLFGFYYVLSRLNSIDNKDFFSYLGSRLTDISMVPVTALIDEPVRMYLLSPFMMINDLLYPFAKVVGWPIESSNVQLSRYIYGVKGDGFSVPVTPGFIAYTFKDFGEPLCYVVVLLYGYLCRYVYYRIGSVKSIYTAWFLLCAQYMLYVGLTSGNLFYLAPNFLLVFAGAFGLERAVSGRQNPTATRVAA